MSDPNTAVVRQFLEALEKKDLSLVKARVDLTFDNPISGKGSGIEAYRSFLSGFLHSIEHIEIKHLLEAGDHVAAHWEAVTVFGVIPVLQLFHFQDGMIADSVTIFDPRPVLGN